MGNRAVLALDRYSDDAIGIYLHWNGSPETIEEYLSIARDKMSDRLGDDVYSAARLVQVIGEQIGGNLSFGLGHCRDLDCDNGDNGTYEIDLSTLTVRQRHHN